MTVSDDGCGITDAYGCGMGLRTMRARAAALGGWLTAHPRAGGGAALQLVVRARSGRPSPACLSVDRRQPPANRRQPPANRGRGRRCTAFPVPPTAAGRADVGKLARPVEPARQHVIGVWERC